MSNRRSLCDFSKAVVIPRLPDVFNSMRKGEVFPSDLIGATIVGFGAAPAEYNLEGGGLIIDYFPSGSNQRKRLVLAFNDCGMWIVG